MLRSSGLEISGSGIGTVSFERIAAEMPRFMGYAAAERPRFGVRELPLSDVARAWGAPGDGRRIVLVP